MINNIYGTIRQAQFNPSNDADVYYSYRPNRSTEDTLFKGFKKIEDVGSVLEQTYFIDENNENRRSLLPGMYTLKLPIHLFGNVGIYTIYITPKEYKCTIKDIGVLAAYPGIKGIVLDKMETNGELPDSLFIDDNLVGYRIEYPDNDGVNRQDYVRIITTCTGCEPITQNLVTTTSNANSYRYNQNGSLVFLTVTPSTTPSFKSNAMPYIGVPNQQIILKNTKFDPISVEVEITEHDIETISYMLEGEQVRNFENGRVTTYNFNGEIYKQMEYSTVKDNYTNTNIAEVKLDKSNNIDNSLDLESLRS